MDKKLYVNNLSNEFGTKTMRYELSFIYFTTEIQQYHSKANYLQNFTLIVFSIPH